MSARVTSWLSAQILDVHQGTTKVYLIQTAEMCEDP